MDTLIKSIIINSTDGVSETIAAEFLEYGTYRIIENPVFSFQINYGTIIDAVTDAKGELVFTQIVRASDFKTRKFLLSTSLTEAALRAKLGQLVLDAGGMWEVVFGGICFVHIPENSAFDLDELFKQHDYYPTEITDDTTTELPG
ncbi:hypothetical protein [Ferruginibacter profundus]